MINQKRDARIIRMAPGNSTKETAEFSIDHEEGRARVAERLSLKNWEQNKG
jgi:hypothetical protein